MYRLVLLSRPNSVAAPAFISSPNSSICSGRNALQRHRRRRRCRRPFCPRKLLSRPDDHFVLQVAADPARCSIAQRKIVHHLIYHDLHGVLDLWEQRCRVEQTH